MTLMGAWQFIASDKALFLSEKNRAQLFKANDFIS